MHPGMRSDHPRRSSAALWSPQLVRLRAVGAPPVLVVPMTLCPAQIDELDSLGLVGETYSAAVHCGAIEPRAVDVLDDVSHPRTIGLGALDYQPLDPARHVGHRDKTPRG